MTKVPISSDVRIQLAAEFNSIARRLELIFNNYSGFDPYESDFFVKSSDALSGLTVYLLTNINAKDILEHESGDSER